MALWFAGADDGPGSAGVHTGKRVVAPGIEHARRDLLASSGVHTGKRVVAPGIEHARRDLLASCSGNIETRTVYPAFGKRKVEPPRAANSGPLCLDDGFTPVEQPPGGFAAEYVPPRGRRKVIPNLEPPPERRRYTLVAPRPLGSAPFARDDAFNGDVAPARRQKKHTGPERTLGMSPGELYKPKRSRTPPPGMLFGKHTFLAALGGVPEALMARLNADAAAATPRRVGGDPGATPERPTGGPDGVTTPRPTPGGGELAAARSPSVANRNPHVDPTAAGARRATGEEGFCVLVSTAPSTGKSVQQMRLVPAHAYGKANEHREAGLVAARNELDAQRLLAWEIKKQAYVAREEENRLRAETPPPPSRRARGQTPVSRRLDETGLEEVAAPGDTPYAVGLPVKHHDVGRSAVRTNGIRPRWK